MLGCKIDGCQAEYVRVPFADNGLTLIPDNVSYENALFVGFAPYEKPKYAISVVIEHGGSGSMSAAPVAVDILRFMIDNNI